MIFLLCLIQGSKIYSTQEWTYYCLDMIPKVEDHGEYIGKASSKKMSKHAASEAVLRDLYPSSELQDVIWVGEKSESPDFSSDAMESDGFIGGKKAKTVISAALVRGSLCHVHNVIVNMPARST